MSKVVDVISRKTAVKTALASEGNLSVSLHEPSVVMVHASAHEVARYERAGKDLLIHMKDGSVIRCNGYFIEDGEQNHGELVFQDDATQTLTHVEFADTSDALGLQSVILHPTETVLTNLDPLMIDSTFSDLPWGMIAAGVLGGGAVGALLAHGGGDSGGTTIIDNTKDVEVANPTFLVSDKQGDRQGLLSTNDVTDDTQPTFSGSGQPGASIQIKDASGNVIASAQVAANGTWSAQLPAQSAGTHHYSVVQINGDKTTSAGDITLNVVTAKASLTLDTLADDNVLNAAEQGAAVTVSGQSSDLASGTVLTVTLNGKTYQTTVGDNGAWSLSVPAADAAALADGVHTVDVSGKDAAGNTVSGSATLTVDTQPPSLAINTVSTDDMINAAESGQALVLSGTTDAEAGQKVTVTLNGKSYEATVNADGSWRTTVPSADVATLTDGNYAVHATVSDKAGNQSSTEHQITADITVPTVSIDTIAGDNVINALEHLHAQTISGSSTGAAAGDKVTVTIDGHTYTTLLDANGHWSVGVPAEVIKGLSDGSHTVSVSITDAAGNTGSHKQEIDVTTVGANLTINTLADNDVINAAAKGQDLALSGTSNLADGTQVTITLNDKDYTATVNGGLWSTRVPAADVAQLGEARYTLNLTATDEHGNPISISHSVQVDSALPVVTINSVTSDDILNEAEIGLDQTISGRVTGAEAGDTVTVNVGGKTYHATVEADLSWKITVPSQDLAALGDGELSISASVTNGHGNTGDASRDILIDANLPGLRIDTVAGDDIVNAIEHQQNLIITGSSTDLSSGSHITVTINGVDYPATIRADGSWSAAVPSADVANWPAGSLNVSASGADSAGNPVQIEHGIEVDLSPVAIAINPVTADNVLNAAEKGADLTLSGTSQNVEAGQTVTISFAGHTYTATVDANGAWSTTVPTVDMANLKDGDASVTVSVTNVNGNSASAGQQISVDATAPTLSVDNITSDNILNAAEAGADLVLSGTSNAEAGQTVTVELNGITYTATVQADGSWSTTVPQGDLAALTDGNYRVEASVTDKAGNPSAAARDVLVDVTAPVVSINTTAGDNVINASEHGQAQIITGSSSGAVAGDNVLVTLNGHEYTTTVDASGNWSIGVPADVVKGLADGSVSITASITDKAGNTGSDQQTVTVNTAIPALTIDTLAGDDVVNAVEKGADLTLSGTSNLADGSTVILSLNGTDYTATVTGGVWITRVPASDVAKLGEANYTVTASTTDTDGNTGSTTHTLLVDSAIPTVSINPVTADNVLNDAEIAVDQEISGRVTGAAAGDTVTVNLGGKTYTAKVESDLSWKVTVPSQDLTALGDGDLTVTASVINGHGNTGVGSRDISVDANLPSLRIDTVAGDDIINAIEHNQNLIVSGTSSDLTAGSTVTVSINGIDYQASVMADGSWSAAVPASDVSQWPAGSVTLDAAAADASGNPVNIGHKVTVDLSTVAVSIDAVTADNVLNAAEKGADLTLSGSTQNVEAGQTVNIQFAGHSYQATVQADGSWKVTVPAADMTKLNEGDANVTASVTNVNGNHATAGHGLSVDTTAPTLSVDNITSDNILNAAEAGADLVVSGTSNAEAGQTVTVKLNGVEYTATVQADGSWHTTVPQGDLAALTDGDYRVEASVADKAGNPSAAARDVLVDTTAPVVTINTVAGDDVINATEHAQAQIVSGSSTGTVAGDKVTLTLDGQTYTTTVDASGNWSVGVPADAIKALTDGKTTLTASITDAAGNTGSVAHDVTVNTVAPTLNIDTLAQDDVINATEKGQDLTLSGTSNQPDGTLITVNLNGTNYSATVSGGNWSTTVPATDVAKLGEANYRVTASTTDVNGNNVSATHDVLVDSAIPTVVINAVTSDNVLNAAEVAVDQVISGRVTGAAAGDTVTVDLGGKTYTAKVGADLSWKVTVSSQDLKALGDGDLTVTASVTNGHGNRGDGSRDISVDANLPGLRINTVAGDDIINAIEHQQDLIVTGTSSDLNPGSTLTVSINGVDYQASVMPDGSWSAAVPSTDVVAWPAGSLNIAAEAADAAGNPVNIGHNITVDLSSVAVSIDSVTADNILNAAEKGADLTLSGSTQNVEAGQTVNIQFAGHSYQATVQADGSWKVTVPAADMTSLKDGDTHVTVSVSNVNGNSAGAAQEVHVDASAPALSINTITSDNILNAAEAGADLTLSGTSTAEAGQTVTVKLNGAQYTATVQADGSWSTTVPQGDLAALTDGDYRVEASVTDKAGNPSAAARDILVDVTAPVVSIHTTAGDNVINATEHGQAQMISGSSTGAVAGDSVVVTLGNHTYTTTVDASGNWSVGVPADVISALADGQVAVSVSITDKAGNTGTDTQNLTVNTQLPTFTIDAITGDNVLNDVEKTTDQTISGKATGLGDGAKVTVTLNGVEYLGTVTGGVWSVNVPAANLSALGEAIYQVTVSGTDAYGNSGSQGQSLQVASTLPGVTIDSVTSDDVLNAAEIAVEQVIFGHVTAGAAAGDTVTVNIGGKTYTTQVENDLSWKVTVPSTDLTALGNGDLTVTASVTDVNGNTGHGSRDISVDANLPGLRIDTVAGDDVINSIEHGQNLIITGSSSDLAPGSSITVTVNGTGYPATIKADGSWSAAIPAGDVSKLPAGSLTITAEGSNSAGNPVSISHTLNVDLTSVAVSIDPVTTDNVLNAAEKGADLSLSGATQNVEAGQTVKVTFAGHTYQARVEADGTWKITVPATDMANLKEGDASVIANVTNVAGNTASAAQEYEVDTRAPALIINDITADNVLNAVETGADLRLSGTSTAEAGQTVTVKLNGVDYTAVVQADGSWSTTVPQADLANLTDGDYRVEGSVSDKAGNPSTASRDVTVDTTAPTVSINTVAGDDVINLTEHAQAQIVSGSSTGAAAGDKVVVTVDGKTYTTTVDASGNWSVGLPAKVVSGLNDGTHSIGVSITDAAGNTGTGSHDVVVNTGVPGLSVNAIAVDNVLNAVEKGEALTVSGSSSNLADGTLVTVNLNGKNYTATLSGGQWSLDVPATDVAKLGEANYTLTVSATNDIGNSISNTADLLVDTAAPTVTINPVTFDDVLNASEVASGQDISGRVSGAAAGDTVTVNVGGHQYTTTVQADLSWKVNVSASDLTAMGNGDLSVTASVTNAHGNSGDGSRDFVIDANLPGLRIATVAGDDIINAIEHGQNLIVSGSSTGLTAGSSVTVTINGKDYPATVLADGSWNAAVPSADVAQWAAGTVIISAAGSSSAGNPVLITHNVTVDLNAVAISIDAVTGDNVLNAAEKGADLVLSGMTQNVEAGQTVNVQFAGHSYTTTVDADGSWKVTVPSADMRTLTDSDVQLQVSVNNAAGNPASAAQGVHVDVSAPALIINDITADNVLNAVETGADLRLSGTSTAEAGQTVTVKLNGVDYTAVVQADGSWSTTVPQADLANLTDGDYRVEGSVSDKAGNPSTASRDVTVDTTAPTVSINTVAGDDVINLTEHAQAQIVSGSSTGAAAGDKVVVTVDGKTYTTTVDASGNWSVGLPAKVVSGLNDGTHSIGVSITDAAGNTGTGSHDVVVNTGVPGLSVNAIAVDNVLNAVEKGEALTVSGSSSNLADGTLVTVNLNGKNYTATLSGGQWSLDVPATDVAKLGEANYTLTVSATNDIGNSISNTVDLLVDTAAPTVTINPVTSDNILNAAEIAVDQTVSGRVSNAAMGDTVTVNIGGKNYTAKVEADLSWKVTVPAQDLTALGDGALTITAAVTNGHGNSGDGARDITVDAGMPGLRVDTVAGDDVVNSIEHNQNLIISGTSSDLAPGSSISVTINGVDYPATIKADGSWSAAVPAADVSEWPAGNINVTASGADGSGNPVQIQHTVNVDLTSVAVSVDSVTADNVINAAEKGADLTLSGSTQNVEAGQTVTVTFSGHTYQADVATDGSWKVTVPAADMTSLKDGDTRVSVSVSNVNGNGANASHELSVDTSAPTLSINNITADNVLNAAETGADLTVSGTSNAETGQTVTVKLNGVAYTATVQADGSWSTTVPQADLAKLTDGDYRFDASVSDQAGNPSAASRDVAVDTTAPTVSFNTVAGDDIINAAEHGQAQIVSGSSTGAATGDNVLVTIDGKTYTTTVDASGNWSVGVPADVVKGLADGTFTLTASITDAAGNTGSESHDIEVNASSVSLSIDTVAQDDVINAAEKGTDLTISGDSALLPSGTVVTVTLNGISYTTTVLLNGSWTLNVPAADVAKLAEGPLTVTASAHDSAGNSAAASHDIHVDSIAPTLSIDTLSGDDMLNAAERGQDLTVKGNTSAEAGQTVTVTLNGKDYTATVNADGTWSLKVPAADLASLTDGNLTVSATVSDNAGNNISQTHDLMVDTTAPVLTFDTVAGDDVINSAEQLAGQTLSGTTDAEAGQPVIVTFNHREYKTTVAADGTWKINVPASDFLGATDGSYVVNVTTTDVAGNSVSDSKTVTLSGAAPTISIDTFAGDDVVSAAEHGTSHVISGTTSGAAAGQTVTITLNGQSYTTTVAADGSWKYTLSANAVQALADGNSYVINASVSNSIGNSASAGHDIRVDTTAPSMGIAINSIDGDSGLSSTDFITDNNQVTMKGSLTATLGNDEKAQISLDSGMTWIDLTVNGTAWTYAQGNQLADGTYTYTVRVIDAAGNVGATASQDVVIDTVAPDASKSISIDAVSRDTGLDAHDFITSDNTLTLSGKLGAALSSDEHAQISIDGGKTWVDVNISGLNWTYVDGRTLADGDHNYQLRVIDQAGNIGATANQVVTVDTTPPDASKTITIDSISDDTGLSGSDFITSDQTLTIHGSLATSLLADETVQISLDGGATWLSTTVIGTQWSYVDSRTLTDGVHQYIVRVVDQAGNVGQTATQNVTVDTVAPDARETISIDGITRDTGLSDSDFITSDTSLTLNGSLGAPLAGDEVAQISTDHGATWTTVNVTGTTWTYTDGRTLTDGSYTYQMRVVDQAGNVGQTASQVVIVDTTAPTQTMTVDAISTDTGASASDFITSDTSLTLSGSFSAALGADERGQISLDGGNTWQFVNVSGKSWTFEDGRTLTDGVYSYQVRVIDTAGNVSATGTRDVIIDTLNPDATPTINTYTDDEGERQGSFGANVITDDRTPLLTGSLSTGLASGEVLEIWRNGVKVGQATVNGTVWTFADTLGADGTYQYIAKAVDLAGNVTHSSEFDLTLDTSVPTTTAAVNALTTADTTPILTGTVSADLVNGQYVVVTVNGVTYSSEEGGRVVVDPAANTWYLQVPDSAALGLQTYDVTAQVKSGAGNGNNTSISHGSLAVTAEVVHDTSWASTAGNSNNNALTFGVNSNGLWSLFANQVAYSSSGVDTYSTNKLTNAHAGTLVSSTLADFDRNGTADIIATDTYYGDSKQPVWIFDGTNYSATSWAMGTTIWYGGVIAYDKTGDGYLDLAYGDAGGDSRTYLVNNNGIMGLDGSGGTAGLTSIVTYRELSGIDINNDGIVDLVQHTNGSGTNALSIINNNGTGKLTLGQSIANVFVNNAANTTTAASMTWADFNGDGYMDLYIASGTGAQTGGVIYYNNGNGTLSTTKSQVETSNGSAGYISAAVDWNGDGQMDIIKLTTYGGSQTATLYTNNSKGASWSASTLKTGLVNVTGIATMDYNWDGTLDLLVSQVNGKVQLIENTTKIADGTAIHLRILDGEGINVFYGNTVQLYNSAGILVASEVINAQSGLGTNDTSALVNFYGLDPNETYSAVLVRAINGVSGNATWDNLVAGDGKESYSLTADAATGGHSGTLTGTGYNDTFIAEEGSYTYVGSGGWETTSNHATWSANGGEDIVDFRNSTVGITVDLSNTGAQNTGFNTSTFNGIEGIAGSNQDDVITGNSGNNIFEGRGGNDTFNIGNGGHDTLLYKLINSTDATGGNGSDTVNGFTVGTWEGTADTDRIDISELLQGSGYTGTGAASYVNGVATLDSAAGNIGDYVKVTTSGSDTVIQIDRDGSGASYTPTTVVTLTGVHTDLATLLANHQLTVV